MDRPLAPFACPHCARDLDVAGDGPFLCPACGKRGERYRFDPVLPKADAAPPAMPQDAVCAHHPTKRADAVCAGTGDYICSLCAVELEGKTYSVQYLNRGGKPLVTRAMPLRLDRPDRAVSLCLLLSLVVACVSPIGLGFAVYYVVQMRRKRREDPLYASVVSRAAADTYAVLTGLMIAGMLVLGVFLLFHR